jgi:hypothetical protein
LILLPVRAVGNPVIGWRSIEKPPAFLDDTAKASLDKVLGILFAVKIELALEAKLEQSGRHA